MRLRSSGEPKKILLITDFFAPLNSVASIRWTGLVKYLKKKFGYEIDLLIARKEYGEKRGGNRVDKIICEDVAYLRETYEIEPTLTAKIITKVYLFLHKVNHSKKNFGQIGFSGECENSDRVFPIRKKIKDWAITRIQDLQNAQTLQAAKRMNIDWSQYDVVISSYSPTYPHLIAKSVKKKNQDAIWIADFRDAFWSESTSSLSRFENEDLFLGCDSVIAVNEYVAQKLPIPSSVEVRIVSNGYDPEHLVKRQRRDNDLFSLVYTGSLTGFDDHKRDLTPVFSCLQALIEEGVLCADDIIVEYAGNNEDIFFNFAEQFPIVHAESYGYISREEVFVLQDSASVLLFCSGNAKNTQGIVTGKIYEYMTSGVPVLAMMSGEVPDSLVKSMVVESNCGFCFEEVRSDSDFAKLRLFLIHAYNEWKRNKRTAASLNWTYVSSFSHEALASEVSDLIQELRDRQVSGRE